MNQEVGLVAQIIADAADKALGIRPDGAPKPHDIVAAEAIAFKYLLIPRADLPVVRDSEHDPNMYLTDGENVVYTSEENARMWVMRDVAVWQHIVAKDDQIARRRDDLARELVQDGAYAYRFAEEPLKLAIDRIIELERGRA